MDNNKKRYDFNFNLSSLSTYTDEVGGELIRSTSNQSIEF